MSLGLAVFASVVLVLAVYHKGFRKVALWAIAVTVILVGLAVAAYFGYDRYTTWKLDRAVKKQQAETEKGVQDCMARLGTPMPPKGIAPDFLPEAYFNNLTACQAYPDLHIPNDPFAAFGGHVVLPPGYMIDRKGEVAPIPPGRASFSDIVPPDVTFTKPKPKKNRKPRNDYLPFRRNV